MDWLEGQSLVPLFSNPNQPVRDFVYSECTGVGGLLGMGHRMVRSKQWKYILTDVSEEALFDEDKDPYEMTNLVSIAEHHKTLAQLRTAIHEWMTRIGDSHHPPPSN